jgi:ATP-dependent helicase HrpA
VDSKGKKLAVDTNLANLQTTLGNQARQAVAAVAQRVNSPIEKTNLTNWDFDDLPQSIESRHGANVVRAFPALLAEKSGISIKLFTTQVHQFHIHPLGTRALVLKSIPSPAKYVQEHLTASENLALAQLQYHSFNAFIDDVIAACTDQKLYELAPDGMIYTKAEFNRLRDAVQASVMDTTFATVELVAKIMVASREAAKAISTVKAFELLSVLAAEKAHIAELLAPGFVSRAGLARLPRVLIYLRATTLRIERMAENPGRDRAAWVEYEQAWAAFVAAGGSVPLPPMSAQKLVKARWMLEELRVSLFAQTLGTPEAISVQRIKKVLG